MVKIIKMMQTNRNIYYVHNDKEIYYIMDYYNDLFNGGKRWIKGNLKRELTVMNKYITSEITHKVLADKNFSKCPLGVSITSIMASKY